jgi:hypothetical protein
MIFLQILTAWNIFKIKYTPKLTVLREDIYMLSNVKLLPIEHAALSPTAYEQMAAESFASSVCIELRSRQSLRV